MIFNNTVLYCKGWYKCSDEMWKDLARCIAVDYRITLSTEQEVVDYLLFLLDENIDVYKLNNRRFGFRYFMGQINYFIDEYKSTYNDAVIRFFISETGNIYASDCLKVYEPDDKVLPFNYRQSYIELFADTIINGRKYHGRWVPAEMREDVIKRINETFPNGKEQENIPINIV